MDTLKGAIPEKLKQAIRDSTVNTLQDTCSSLHHFFLHFDPFHQVLPSPISTISLISQCNYSFAISDCDSTCRP